MGIRRLPVVIALVAIWAVMFAGLATVPAQAQVAGASGRAARASASLNVAPSAVVAGEAVKATGRLFGGRAIVRNRQVILQVKTGSSWTKLATAKTTSTGTFEFTARGQSESMSLRVLAPMVKAKNGKKVKSRQVTWTRVVKSVAQEISVTGPGSTFVNKAFTLDVAVTPARPGRVLSLQALTGGAWVPVAYQEADQNGGTSFSATIREAGPVSYRVVAGEWRGAASVTSATIVVNVAPGPVTGPVITTEDLPYAFVGTAYSQRLATAGNRTGTWSMTAGALPAGLSLYADGTITGKPTGDPGSSAVRVRFTNAEGQSTAKFLSLTVLAASKAPLITTDLLPYAFVGTVYSQRLATAGNRTGTWSMAAGALPAGLSLSADGTITGTPTGDPGRRSFTVRFTNAERQSTTKSLSLTVLAAPKAPLITTDLLPYAFVGTVYSQRLATAGNRTGTWSMATGALPAGLSLSAEGKITGTPTGDPGRSAFTVRFTNAEGQSTTKFLSLTVLAAAAEPDVPAACTEQSSIPAIECSALVAITDANPTSLTTWRRGDPCTWAGVSCSDGSVDGLKLSDEQLTTLPAEIGNLTSLTVLELEDNRLTSLPGGIGKLTGLTFLDLLGNELTSVPAEIGKLTSLTFLDLLGNELTSVPAEIGKLTSLTFLSLSYNQLTSVPTAIWKLTSLRSLYLDGNELTSLPGGIGKLTSLMYLGLSDNELTSVPAEIGKLTSLIELRLSDNELTSVPAEVGKLTSLIELRLSDNRLSGIVSPWAKPLSVSLPTSMRLRLSGNGCLSAGGDAALGAWLTSKDVDWQDGCG